MFFREWFAVFFALSFLCVIFFSRIFTSNVVLSVEERVCSRKVCVCVEGAVDRPGRYEVNLGSSLQEVLSLAGIKKIADRKAFYLKARVFEDCLVRVPEKNVKKNKKKKNRSSSISITSCSE